MHTGQNGIPMLSDVFFTELGLRQPDHWLQGAGDITRRDARRRHLRDRAHSRARCAQTQSLVLGDTNSCFTAIMAKR